MFDPLFGRGELGKMFEPLFGLGELGKIFEPLFFVENASPAYESAKLVKTARATVTITARNRFTSGLPTHLILRAMELGLDLGNNFCNFFVAKLC